MTVQIRVPALGESVVDGTVARWLKHEGDAVAVGDTVAEIETDKINIGVESDTAGTIERLLVQEGDTVAVGTAIADVAAGAAQIALPVAAEAPTTREATAPDAADNGRPPATPVAARIAADSGIDLGSVEGSGSSGRIRKQDVAAALERGRHPEPALPTLPAQLDAPRAAAPAPAPQPAAGERPEQRIRMTRRRQAIAENLVRSQHTAAMLTTFNEVDMTAIVDMRKRRRDAFKERHGVSLGFMSFFTRAIVGALKAYPRLNAEIQGDEIVLKQYYDIGIAVGAEEGLVVPVVRDADRKSFGQIEAEIADLAGRARDNKLTLADITGGTFTITNGGVFGSLLSTPILNGSQVGILGMHRIQDRPMAIDGAVAIRPMMYLALSYDHRIVDGSEAVRFLVTVKEMLEDPESLLLEA